MPSFSSSDGKGMLGVVVKIVEEKRYMVQGSEKKKTVIDVTLIQRGLKRGQL